MSPATGINKPKKPRGRPFLSKGSAPSSPQPMKENTPSEMAHVVRVVCEPLSPRSQLLPVVEVLAVPCGN